MEAEGRIGPILGAEGTKALIRLGKTAEVITSDLYEEDALRGDLFYASVAVGGVDHAASLTTTAPFALYNPPNSPVDLVVLAVSMGYVSGTLGAGFLAAAKYFQDSLKVTPTGTTCVARGSLKLADGPGAMQGVPLETVTLTAGAVLLFPICDIAPKLATTAGNSPADVYDLKYRVVVPPGATLVVSGICGAAGTTPRVTIGAIWKEVRRIG